MKRGKNFYLLSVLRKIQDGKSPSQISKNLNFSKQKLNYYVGKLKKEGCIEKVGYGVWKYIKPYKEVKKISSDRSKHWGEFKENNVRGHAFMFKLELPKGFRNWDKREKILKDLKIKFEPYYVGGIKRGQRLTAQKTKVALTNRSIIVHFPESFIAETSTLAKKDAVAKFLRVIKHLERIMRADFSLFGKYKFRVSRQHYALIKNSLAKQYLDNQYNSKKLHVYATRGLWLLIDNSYNLEELETVNSESSEKDNEKVQDFFNGLDLVDGYTPQFVMKAIKKNADNLGFYAEHLKSHVAAVKQLGESVVKLTEKIKKLSTHTK